MYAINKTKRKPHESSCFSLREAFRNVHKYSAYNEYLYDDIILYIRMGERNGAKNIASFPYRKPDFMYGVTLFCSPERFLFHILRTEIECVVKKTVHRLSCRG